MNDPSADLPPTEVVLADIGAVGGIDERWSQLTRRLRVLLFEPDPRVVDELRRESPEHWQIFNTALGRQRATLDFHLCRSQQCSSLYRPNQELLKRWPNADRFEVENVVKVEVEPLDEVVEREKIDHIDFIKVDTQGSEFDILAGAEKTLKGVIGVEVETEFTPIYTDQKLFPDVYEYLVGLGFELFDIRRCHWPRGALASQKRGQLVFGDSLFIRPPEWALGEDDGDPARALRALEIYLAYGYRDLIQSLLDKMRDRSQIGATTRSRLMHSYGLGSAPGRLSGAVSRRIRRVMRAIDRRLPGSHGGWDQDLGGN